MYLRRKKYFEEVENIIKSEAIPSLRGNVIKLEEFDKHDSTIILAVVGTGRDLSLQGFAKFFLINDIAVWGMASLK